MDFLFHLLKKSGVDDRGHRLRICQARRREENFILENSHPGGALQLYLYGGVWPQDRKIDPSAD